MEARSTRQGRLEEPCRSDGSPIPIGQGEEDERKFILVKKIVC